MIGRRATDTRIPGLLPAPLADWLTRWGPKVVLAVLVPLFMYAIVVTEVGP